MIRVDREATEARKFSHQDSYVRPDGREHLFGADMSARRKEVWIRSKGFCEMPMCQRNISEETFEMHHDKHRSKGGDDSMANLLASCRRCHTAHHNRYPRLGTIPVGPGDD